MTPPSWLNPPVWTVRRAGQPDTAMGTDELIVALIGQGCDAITAARIETALDCRRERVANEWLEACGSTVRVAEAAAQPSAA